MIIKNGLLLNKDFRFVRTDISFDRKITGIGSGLSGPEVIDAAGCYVVPGLIDTHMHGAVGENFLDHKPETAAKICSFEAKSGTTTLVPAISASTREKMKDTVRYLAQESKKQESGHAKILGIHLEGPFLSGKAPGSMNPDYIRIPDMDEFNALYEAGEGLIRIITMAPETENAYPVIDAIHRKNVAVSIGHSGATFQEAEKALEHGVSRVTHMFNAMSPLCHREPGVAGFAMFHGEVNCELICDFFHVHKEVVQILYRLKGADHITMISDSEVGTGMPDGVYTIYGNKIIVRDRKTYTENGTICGGTTVLLDGVKNLVSVGIALEEAVKMASQNGAEAAGIADRVGSLETGKDADLLILDPDLNLKRVILNGKVL